MVTLQFIILTDNVYRQKRFWLDYERNCKEYQDLSNASDDLTMAMHECGLFSWQYSQLSQTYRQSEFVFGQYMLSRLKVHSLALLNR